MQNATAFLLSDPNSAPRRRSRCNCFSWKCVIIFFVFVAILAVSVTATYFITNKVDKARYYHREAPQVGCGANYTLQEKTWYYGVKHLSFGTIGSSTFRYALSFASDSTQIQIRQDYTELHLGTLFVCGEVEGYNAISPFNCSNSGSYDTARCGVAWRLSDCTNNVATDSTDMHIDWIAFDSNLNLLNVSFKSHTPGAEGIMSLAPLPAALARPIDCPLNATSKLV